MEIKKCILTKSDCYKRGRKITPVGIVVHSTGAINPNLKRYVQPDDGILGKNIYNNDWNRSGVGKCVHAFIGKDKLGEVRCYQTLPWNYRPDGCGAGSRGSYNNGYIQFEICEDDLTDKEYFSIAFEKAIELCKYLIIKYPTIKLENVVSHKEAHNRGYASNHGDCDYWLKTYGKDMDWFRSQVASKVTLFTRRITGEWDKGVSGTKIDLITLKASEGKLTIRAHRIDGKWGSTRSGYSTKKASCIAGKKGVPIDAVAIKATRAVGKLQYRVHRTDGKWGGWIEGYSTTDTSCYAGKIGVPIDALEVRFI